MSLHEVTSQQNCERYEQFCTWKMSPIIARIQSLVLGEELHSSVRSHWEVPPLEPSPPIGFEKETRRAEVRRMQLRSSLCLSVSLLSLYWVTDPVCPTLSDS